METVVILGCSEAEIRGSILNTQVFLKSSIKVKEGLQNVFYLLEVDPRVKPGDDNSFC